MAEEIEPQLAPPGAGLPRIEQLIARVLFARRRRNGSREAFNAHFRNEHELIRKMVEACSRDSGARRVLIQRVRGLEDSSRYWSVWMTLDHLRIVNGQIARIVEALSNGIVPPGKASTATIKPGKAATESVVRDYEEACDKLLSVIASVTELRTPVRYAHPWFGPLDAFGWHAMAAGHMSIHRVQLERIVSGLSRA